MPGKPKHLGVPNGRMVLAVSDGELSSTVGPQDQSEGRGSSLSIHSLPSGPSSPFPTEEQPVASWGLSFERLLQDPLGLAYFTEFLKKEFSAENLTFWKACERFQQIPASDTQQLAREARNIYQEFLSSQALSPVNIDRQAWVGEEMLAEPRPDMFRAQQLQRDGRGEDAALLIAASPLELSGTAANLALRQECPGSLSSSASLDLGFLAFLNSKSESESRQGKYCCVYLPDGTASLVLARPGLTIRAMLAGICEKRGLSLPDIKVYLVGNEQKALVLDQDCAVLADQEVRLENRITFQQPLDLGKLVSSVAAQRLVLDTLPGVKISETGDTSPRRSQRTTPGTQDKGTHLPPLPLNSLAEAPSSVTGKRQTCDIEGTLGMVGRVQSSGAHDQRGLLRKEDLVLPEFLQLPAPGPNSQEAPPQTESSAQPKRGPLDSTAHSAL
ncbi:PREDICTED: regulator of G-protein signaling 14 [Myotis davidii]|uniref:regulator of G-protein signaling 14 n=1 Tax=Myotis davidii TaxID=225400 RepID=UPI0003EC0079|nr:PREDICTED: regulator of G-protein signaling 14 [Myotis davidii]